MRSFTYNARPARVVFGSGAAAAVGEEVRRLQRSRVLLLGGPHVADAVAAIQHALGSLVVARFDDAAMHTPIEVTVRALETAKDNAVDCVVSVGGGSTTGLSKALAVRAGYDQVIVPTTYAGSEVTPVLGETENGSKTTRSSADILPEVVVYDVDLTLGMPTDLTLTSAVNALAHAVEALYSPEANPVVDGVALQAVTQITRALPAVMDQPGDRDARAELLQSAWLAGICFASVAMGLHHKLCHTLGGSFALPHAPTHTVVLPHAMAYNAPASHDAMTRIAEAMRVPDAPAGVFDLVSTFGGPTSLADLGFDRADIGRAAQLAVARPYPNPREVTGDGIATLLEGAHAGRRPGGGTGFPRIRLDQLTRTVLASFDATFDSRLHALMTGLVSHAHEFVTTHDVTQEEWAFGIDFLTRTGQISSDTRQETVLLSDTLGISSAVDMLANSRVVAQTPSAILGPFYVEDPSAEESGADIAHGTPGAPMWVQVAVTHPDGTPIRGAVIDVWQSNADGFYDVQLADLDRPVLRARFRTDTDGRVCFWSILPHEYPIPDDGPVGQMLAAVGRHPYRAPHVHFMICAPGYRRLITQLFPASGKYLDSDAVFAVNEALIIDIPAQDGPTPDGRAVDGRWHLLDYVFHLAPSD
ncbi:maleylacetate reductase and hydroxyquinol 1,2-dioxygenase domain-containing protein [Mycobacterium sp. pUA109]|uniref:maleylacetate reductase and hydroxyquinol 1,2-dioxygenase domain-containing protein n=1 Tax=Mycobacterium sp. pUA109 TaxID=3238982 RepID=UPI00351B6B0F